MNKKKKNGELSEEDEAAYRKENINPLSKDVIAAIGLKNYEEIKPFNDKVHPLMFKMK
ncbi:MAG: hypothetical protein HC798_00315 [Polaribacter sp.]|nr:hypothetical protein [Polaribacter sp.]